MSKPSSIGTNRWYQGVQSNDDKWILRRLVARKALTVDKAKGLAPLYTRETLKDPINYQLFILDKLIE